MKPLLLLAFAWTVALPAVGQDRLVTLDTRPGVTVAVYLMKREGAKATVALLPGGGGGIGLKGGIPTSTNFLVRSRDLFAAQGFHVAVVSRPSDTTDMKGDFRTSPRHIEDLRYVAAFLKKELGAPIWLAGTSRGTISTAAAAIHLGNADLAGIVLTSSIVGTRWDAFPGRPAPRDGSQYAVPNQDLGAIRIPVLVLHHRNDACGMCAPSEVHRIEQGLANAPVKKTVLVDGGAGATGDPCEPMHWHGYIGMEKEAVRLIADWIRSPN